MRWAIFSTWGALAGLAVNDEWAVWTRALHPPFLPVGLLLCTMLAGLVTLFWKAVRLIRKRPAFSLTALAFGALPAALLAWPLISTSRQWADRQTPPTWQKNFATVFGAALMDGEIRRKYPHRLESDRIVMWYGDSVKSPREELAAMDAHVAGLERLLGQTLREKIWWVRGPVLGQFGVSFLGLSIGSEEDHLADMHLDRHELAHGVIDQFKIVESVPPALVQEGWAEANSGIDDLELASRALVARETEPRMTLRELLSERWYDRHIGPVYAVGGAFSRYMIRRFGAKRFLEFYVRSRPGYYAGASSVITGVDFDEIERDFWADARRIVERGSKETKRKP